VKWTVDFNAFAYADTEQEAKLLFDRLSEAAETVLCGVKEQHDECPRSWMSGGRVVPESEYEQ
jgi:hypothetical protein